MHPWAEGLSAASGLGYVLLEPVQRLLCGDGVEILPVQLGRDAIGRELKAALPTTDLKSEKLEALGDVDNPGFLPVKRHAEFFEDFRCLSQDGVRLGPSAAKSPPSRPPNA